MTDVEQRQLYFFLQETVRTLTIMMNNSFFMSRVYLCYYFSPQDVVIDSPFNRVYLPLSVNQLVMFVCVAVSSCWQAAFACFSRSFSLYVSLVPGMTSV